MDSFVKFQLQWIFGLLHARFLHLIISITRASSNNLPLCYIQIIRMNPQNDVGMDRPSSGDRGKYSLEIDDTFNEYAQGRNSPS